MAKNIKSFWQTVNPGDKMPEGGRFALLMRNYYDKMTKHTPEDLGHLILCNQPEDLRTDLAKPDSYILLVREWFYEKRALAEYWDRRVDEFQRAELAALSEEVGDE